MGRSLVLLAMAFASTLAACSSVGHGPQSLQADLILVGRIVSERQVSDVAYGGIDVTITELPAYTLEPLGQPGMRVEFVGGLCPKSADREQNYLVFLNNKPRQVYGVRDGAETRFIPLSHLAACTAVGKSDALSFSTSLKR